MDFYTSVPSVTWSAPETWSVGTRISQETSVITNSSSAATSPAGTTTTGQTFTGSNSGGSTSGNTTNFDATGSSILNFRSNVNSSHAVQQFIPSTTTAGTSTITLNGTTNNFTTVTSGTSLTLIDADTYEATSSTTARSSNTNGGTTTLSGTSTFSNDSTITGFQTTFSSSSATLAESTLTTSATGTFTLPVTSTSSYPVTTGAGTATGTTSSWSTVDSSVSFSTSLTVSQTSTAEVTYQSDYSTFVTTATITRTLHNLSPLRDSVILQNAIRDLTNYYLGNEVQIFSLGTLAATASTALRFSQIHSSVSDATYTMADLTKFQSTSQAATAITVSINTVATTTTAVTGTTSTATGTVNTTVNSTSKNGVSWNATNPANTVTATQTFNNGAISTSLFTFTAPGTTLTTTHSYGTIQTSGYDSASVWTSTTSTTFLGFDSSFTGTRLSLYNSASTTTGTFLFSSFTEEILTSRFETSGTNTVFVGMGKTTTTAFYVVDTTMTASSWGSRFNPEVSNYTTSSASTMSAASGTSSTLTNYTISQSLAATYHTEEKVQPQLWTYPSNSFSSPFTQTFNQVWYSAPPAGFGGFGGDFTASSLPVYLSVQIGLLSGTTFDTSQSLATGDLPTALAYDSVTFFPVRTDFPITVPDGAQGASYISRLSTLGDSASIAVTWTGTTTATGTGTASTTTTTAGATYTLAGQSAISGTVFRSAEIEVNTTDVRGELLNFGGYAGGDNALEHEYTVRVGFGYAAWTAYGSQSSDSTTNSTSGTGGSLTFTVAGTNAIVISAEPLYTVTWAASAGEPFYSSIPHFPS